MRQKRTLILGLVFFFTVALLPAHAGAWRSSTGNIFRFQSNGNVSYVAVNGGSANGRWWWYNRSAGQFQYQMYNGDGTYTVQMQGNNQGVVYWPRGQVSYWVRLGGRGAADEDAKDMGAEKSGWLMLKETP